MGIETLFRSHSPSCVAEPAGRFSSYFDGTALRRGSTSRVQFSCQAVGRQQLAPSRALALSGTQRSYDAMSVCLREQRSKSGSFTRHEVRRLEHCKASRQCGSSRPRRSRLVCSSNGSDSSEEAPSNGASINDKEKAQVLQSPDSAGLWTPSIADPQEYNPANDTFDEEPVYEADEAEDSTDEESFDEDYTGEMDSECVALKRRLWSEVQKDLRPTQNALGYDWAMFKLQNLLTFEDAQAYMDSKPVPYVKRGSKMYIVDHHHTLVALQMSGWDVEISLQCVEIQSKEERSRDSFWGYLEGRGWAFLRDDNYSRVDYNDLPKCFEIGQFRNDLYRSMGGFARRYKLLKRGKTLNDRLFFEFRWGYLFWLNREYETAGGLWPDEQAYRGWRHMLDLVSDIDNREYIQKHVEETEDVEDLIFLSQQLIEPAYKMMIFYLRQLCYAYDALEGDDRKVKGLSRIFGNQHVELLGEVLPEARMKKDLRKEMRMRYLGTVALKEEKKKDKKEKEEDKKDKKDREEEEVQEEQEEKEQEVSAVDEVPTEQISQNQV